MPYNVRLQWREYAEKDRSMRTDMRTPIIAVVIFPALEFATSRIENGEIELAELVQVFLRKRKKEKEKEM